MNDCETIILDQLKEIRADVKALSNDVAGLKVRSAIWGAIGAAIFTFAMTILPLLVSKPSVTHASTQTYIVKDSLK